MERLNDLTAKQHLVSLLKNELRSESEMLMHRIVTEKLERDPDGIHAFFEGVYGEIRTDLATKKLDLKRKTRNLIESLAFPYAGKTDSERIGIYREIVSGKTYYNRKKRVIPETDRQRAHEGVRSPFPDR